MIPFDPNKATAGYVSPPLNGACYYQEGRYYNNTHDLVDPNTGEILEKAKGPVQVAKPVEDKSKTKPRASQRKARPGLTTESITNSDDAPPTPAEPVGIDLMKWLEGKAKYPFFTIKAEVQKQFGREPANAKEAREIIAG